MTIVNSLENLRSGILLDAILKLDSGISDKLAKQACNSSWLLATLPEEIEPRIRLVNSVAFEAYDLATTKVLSTSDSRQEIWVYPLVENLEVGYFEVIPDSVKDKLLASSLVNHAAKFDATQYQIVLRFYDTHIRGKNWQVINKSWEIVVMKPAEA